ncbi:MAG TPA: glycine zipper domain-containing protein [Gemmata sp.]|nr:glycine zipper domain-containing protein [Gemmata sp.]
MRTCRGLRVGVLGSVLFGSLGSVGCESMNHTERGAAIGGALGTAAGLGIGAATGNPRTGAVIGGLGGAGVGALVGGEKDEKARKEREVIHANAVANAQAQAQRMGLSDVMHMAREGHADQVIINQIRSTGSTFQLTSGDLDMLKNNGVSPTVISEMQNARPASPLSTRVIVRDPQPTTVIYQEPPPVVFVPRPYCPPRPPVMVVGGYIHHRH